MRKVLFVGPSYPPDWVMKYIKDIIINVYTSDTLSSDTVGNAFIKPVVIKELTISNAGVSCTIEYVNPITGDIIEQSTSSGDIAVVTKGEYVNSFYGGPYNISPCCISLTYIKDVSDKPDVVLNCKHPLRCSVSDNILNITAEETLTLEANATFVDSEAEENEKNSIVTVNGLRVVNGEITINGVGTVTVTVNSAEVEDE